MIGRIRGLLRDDRGLSMTELLVAMLVTSIILAIAGSFFMQTMRVTTNSQQTQTSTRTGAVAASTMTQTLRMGTTLTVSTSLTADSAIVAGSRNSVTVYSNVQTKALTPSPTRVTYTLSSAGVLTEDRCAPKQSGTYWTFATCQSTSSRTIASGIVTVAGGAAPLFTYYAGDTAIDIGSGSLTDSQRSTVTKIAVTVTSKSVSTGTKPSIITNTVVLRNLGLEVTQ